MQRTGSIIALIIILFATVAFSRFHNALVQPTLIDAQIETLPMQLGPWRGRQAGELESGPREILKLDRYLRRTYENDEGKQVYLYVGYWKKQSGEHQAAKHSPAICLPSNGWSINRLKRILFSYPVKKPEDSPVAEFTINRLTGEFERAKLLFYYYFFSGDKIYAQEWQSLFNISMETFFNGRSDGGIVEVSAPYSRLTADGEYPQEVEDTIKDFMSYFAPALKAIVNQAR